MVLWITVGFLFSSEGHMLFLDSGFLSSNSTIVPLFEKVLSASDAGRIGRLVLPKACAEVSLLLAMQFGFYL